MKRLKNANIIAALFIVLLTIAAFFDLFYPSLRIFITPEMGVSDIWQFNLPVKNFLRESLTTGSLPVWNKNMGGGFPVLAEGQVGTFYIPNLILFYFFQTFAAFNLSYVLAYIIAGLSMFGLTRILKRSVFASLLSAIAFMFGGFFITHIYHINMIQSAAYLPLLFLLSYLIIENKVKKNTRILIFITSFILSQQIFAGFPQMVFLTLFAIFSYLIFHILLLFKSKKPQTAIKPSLYLIIAVILGFLLSGVQLLPSYQLTKLSQRSTGLLPNEVLNFSYRPSLFKTFLNPFSEGSPKDGSYPNYTEYGGAIFWENIGYIGLLPLFLAPFGLLFLKKERFILFLGLLLITSVLLMLGKYSPLYVLLVFPPINFFRIHSRFILLVIFSLTLLSAFGVDNIIQIIKDKFKIKKSSLVINLIYLIIISLTLFDLYKTWFNYQLKIDAKSWSVNPDTVNYLNSVNHGKILSLNRYDFWSSYFNDYGWTQPEDYIGLRNALFANSNIFFNIPQIDAYSALYSKRWLLLNGIIQEGLNGSPTTFNISSQSAKLLSSNNVTHIIASPYFKDEKFKQVYKTPSKVLDHENLSIYENPNTIPRAYFVNNYFVSKTVTDAYTKLTDESYIPGKTVVLEKDIDLEKTTEYIDVDIEIIKDQHQEFIAKINTPKRGLFVLSDSFYPGWRAYVDGKESEVLAANINNRAIIVNQGDHIVTFKYDNKIVKWGGVVSGITLITMLLALFPVLPSFLEKFLNSNHSFAGQKNNPYKLKRDSRKPQSD